VAYWSDPAILCTSGLTVAARRPAGLKRTAKGAPLIGSALPGTERAESRNARQRRRAEAAAAGPPWRLPLEIFHVFDQRPLVLITEVTPIGVSPVFDEVRACVHFDQLGHHSLEGHGTDSGPAAQPTMSYKSLYRGLIQINQSRNILDQGTWCR
jgi:hypothetical protein